MDSFDDVRLAVAVNVAADIERAVKYHLDTTDRPGELARGWEAYRSAVGLRKSLDRWIEMRTWQRANPELVDPIDAVKA